MKKKIKNAIFNVWCVVFSLLDFPAMIMHNAYQVLKILYTATSQVP